MQAIVNIEEKIKELKDRLRKDDYAERLIDYKELQKLNKKYLPEMEEKSFALEVLELNLGNYMKMKNKGSKGKILKTKSKIKQEEERNEDSGIIVDVKIKLKHDGYEERLISYEELKQLNEKYMSEMEEKVFATQVLNLSYANYMKMKNKGQRGRILKKCDDISEEKVEEIKRKLKAENYEGKLIDYKKVQMLHNKYISEIEEKIFAVEILGFTYDHYLNVKNKGKRGKIRDKRITIKSDYVKKTNLTQARFYTQEELQTICEVNNITIEEFIKYIILNFNTGKLDEAILQYKKAINKHGKLWIGKIPLSDNFAKSYIDLIYVRAQRIAYKYKAIYKYNEQDAEDYIQELAMYAMGNCGDLEKNFQDEKEFFEKVIYNKMKYYLFRKMFDDKRINLGITSTIKRNNETGEEYEHIHESKVDVSGSHGGDLEDDLDINVSKKCIDRLKQLVAEGCDKKTALFNVQEEFDLEREELITIMTNYINNKVNDISDETR